MRNRQLNVKVETLLSVIFIDFLFILVFADKMSNFFIYFIFFSFFLLMLSYFTEFIINTKKLQNYFYNSVICICFPIFSSYIVCVENFKTESIFLLFVHFIFFIFFINYKNYLASSFFGIIIGVALAFFSSPLHFDASLTKEYTLCILSILSSFFLWKTICKQFLESVSTREKEIEDNIKMIAHELNGPLSSIKILSTELQKKTTDNPVVEKTLYKIVRYVDLCLFNINFRKDNLRNYISSKNETQFDIKNFLDDCISNFQKTHTAAIDIKIFGKSFYLVTNDVFLSTIFSNLLDNAFFFIQKAEKGSISIDLETSTTNHVIIFKDTGYGIKPDHLPFIFDKGFSRRRNGTGMGLYMCQNHIEHLGGNIICESRVGEFTKFIITFPRPSRL
jgi:signal transduction histidine kinase